MRIGVLLVVLLTCSCTNTRLAPEATPAPTAQVQPQSRSTSAVPKNIILLIGDGMGITQISAGMYINDNYIAFERMPIVGLHKSYSSDDLVTDSAAGATAFSCGVKTYNGAIAVNPDQTPCPTLLELAEQQGKPTGLVATSTIVHATPAAFYAHANSRESYELIAAQLAASDVDFFIGGGQRYFDQRKSDQRDLLAEMAAKGRVVDSYFDRTIGDLRVNNTKTYGYLTSHGDPLPVAQGRNYFQKATALCLDFLTARDTEGKGFFAMIEGSQIDWGGHANNSDYIITEMIEFSQVVDDVLDFAAAEGNTLVVVTADHETGGYAINKGSTMDSIAGAFTSDYHTADLIPVFAYGPGAEAFSGIYENTAIYDKLRALMVAAR